MTRKTTTHPPRVEPEPARGPGRPPIGRSIHVRLEPDQRAKIDGLAADRDVPVAAVIRDLITIGLNLEWTIDRPVQ